MAVKSGAALKREQIRQQYWPTEDLWTGDDEKGWFAAPRTIPLILSLLASKPVSGKMDPSLVYLELLSRQRSEGIIEMSTEADHAFSAGYQGPRAVRAWQERMKILEENHFILIQKVGNERYKYVAIVHPTDAVQRLRDGGKISDAWWTAYFDRKLNTKELTYDQRMLKRTNAAKVVPITPPAPVVPPPPPSFVGVPFPTKTQSA